MSSSRLFIWLHMLVCLHGSRNYPCGGFRVIVSCLPMPPKRAAAATATAVSTRPSRKRAATDDAEAASTSKRPKRAVATAAATKPVAKKPPVPPRKSPLTTSTAKRAAPPRKLIVPTRKRAPPPRPSVKKAPKVEVVVKPKVPRVPKPKAPTLNALISVPSPPPIPFHAFVFGNGDAGQFGLGVDVLSEIGRPKIHTWVEEAIKDDKYGGKGLENIVAGGMHTLAVTSDGQVCLVYRFVTYVHSILSRYGAGASMMRALLVARSQTSRTLKNLKRHSTGKSWRATQGWLRALKKIASVLWLSLPVTT